MPDTADLILLNGRVTTLDRACPEAEAVAVRDGRILAAGTAAEAMAHGRVTVADRAVQEAVNALHEGPEPPRVRHLIGPSWAVWNDGPLPAMIGPAAFGS